VSDTEWFDRPMGDPIRLVPYDTRWATAARGWCDRILRVLAPLEVVVDHVGSTAVPGLRAKPVLDLQVQVPRLRDESAYLPHLSALGLTLRARAEAFRFLRPPTGAVRAVHVHVCGIGSAWATDHLAFRDALRADAATARLYEQLKADLSARHRFDRGAYNAGKATFIRGVLADRGTGPRS